MSASATPPSAVRQTAPPPEPPPESVAPDPTPQGAVGPVGAASEVTAFDIVVRAPPAVRDLLEKHLELQRYRAVTDLDDSELARLIVLAERDVRNLVGTLGYFSPDIRIGRSARADRRQVISVDVEPGEQTRIGPVAITFTGAIADSTDGGAAAQQGEITRGWRLPAGQPFTQDAWSSAKNQALRQLVSRRYPAGRIAGSLADINAPDRTASLRLDLDSGPLYRLGPLQVSGVDKYDPVLVPRLARLQPGQVYDLEDLAQAQQRLAASGYFDSASVFINPEGDPAAVPVQVQVRESPLQKLILGVGVTTDSGPRVSVEHTHQRLPGIGWRAVSKLQLEKKSPFAQTEWTAIPDADNWRWGVLARAERIDDDGLITQGQRLRWGRSQVGDRIDRNVYLQYERANVQGMALAANSAAATGDGSALTANYVWTGRYFDSLPFPSSGYALGFELGLGTTLGQDRQPFTRMVGRWLGVKPLERGQIALRVEAGAVLSRDTARIPSSQLFRTGGDTTVRGYGYRAIGIQLPGDAVGPGRYEAVASVEWQRPMLRGGQPSEFENTLFLDAGAVADRPRALRPSVGIGTGLRWRSPIGPLQIDLAYGLKVRRARLHISLGFVF